MTLRTSISRICFGCVKKDSIQFIENLHGLISELMNVVLFSTLTLLIFLAKMKTDFICLVTLVGFVIVGKGVCNKSATDSECNEVSPLCCTCSLLFCGTFPVESFDDE